MSPGSTIDAQDAQRRHYDEISARYLATYGDEWSMEYRRRFIDGPMFEGMDLRGKAVLEAMCGSGQTTARLLELGASVTGLDISPEMARSFAQTWPECKVVAASIVDSGLPAESFDAVVIVGGLHHLHPYVDDALREIHRLLRPGGHLCFTEPHAASFQDGLRRIWYRIDTLFERNEAAIDVDALKARFAGKFVVEREHYLGNFAYFLVLNSMVFRAPKLLKRLYSRPLMALEGALPFLQHRRIAAFCASRWRKLP
jgi:SAM-dependent methyltransferase